MTEFEEGYDEIMGQVTEGEMSPEAGILAMTTMAVRHIVSAAESIAEAMGRQADVAEQGLEIARENLKVHQQMAGTSNALENELANAVKDRKP